MERLTAISENGKAYYPYCFREDTCDGCGSSEKCDQCELSLKVCETLAAYENTGLTPEQVMELKERDTAKAPVQYGEMMMDKKYCGNCFYFNGEKGDGMQFCDEREEYVHESSWCCHHVTDPEKED